MEFTLQSHQQNFPNSALLKICPHCLSTTINCSPALHLSPASLEQKNCSIYCFEHERDTYEITASSCASLRLSAFVVGRSAPQQCNRVTCPAGLCFAKAEDHQNFGHFLPIAWCLCSPRFLAVASLSTVFEELMSHAGVCQKAPHTTKLHLSEDAPKTTRTLTEIIRSGSSHCKTVRLPAMDTSKVHTPLKMRKLHGHSLESCGRKARGEM